MNTQQMQDVYADMVLSGHFGEAPEADVFVTSLFVLFRSAPNEFLAEKLGSEFCELVKAKKKMKDMESVLRSLDAFVNQNKHVREFVKRFEVTVFVRMMAMEPFDGLAVDGLERLLDLMIRGGMVKEADAKLLFEASEAGNTSLHKMIARLIKSSPGSTDET
jgi:hypothetical protein